MSFRVRSDFAILQLSLGGPWQLSEWMTEWNMHKWYSLFFICSSFLFSHLNSRIPRFFLAIIILFASLKRVPVSYALCLRNAPTHTRFTDIHLTVRNFEMKPLNSWKFHVLSHFVCPKQLSTFCSMKEQNEQYKCINCLAESDSLYQKYSEGVIRLTECVSELWIPSGFFFSNFVQKNCGKIVDRYIEYETVMVVVDMLLHYIEAYRHILYNMKIKVIL